METATQAPDRRRPPPRGRLARADRDRLPGPRGHGHRHGGQLARAGAGPCEGRHSQVADQEGRRRGQGRQDREEVLDLDFRSRLQGQDETIVTISTKSSRSRRRADDPDRRPRPDQPELSLATVGPAPIGVPNFFIDKFRIPPFLLPIYQAAGMQYGVRWEILAAINEIETDYGRNLNVSYAGALGWMQFMPATWKMYGVDANNDGDKDPYNPVDAIFAAARYLRAAGADKDLRRAIFAYNHADWYVDSVLLRARVIGGLPATSSARSPASRRAASPCTRRPPTPASSRRPPAAPRSARAPTPPSWSRATASAAASTSSPARARPAIAVNDGRIIRVGRTKRLGRFVKLLDVYGNTYTYAHLGTVAPTYPAPKKRTAKRSEIPRELKLDKAPKAAARRPRRPPASTGPRRRSASRAGAGQAAPRPPAAPGAAAPARSACSPIRRARTRRVAGGAAQLGQSPTMGRPTPRRSAWTRRTSSPSGSRGRPRDRRHRPRPHRQGQAGKASAHALRDPPGRPRRPARRPEADPRRLEAARVDRDLPRREEEPVRRRGRQDPHDRPDPAHEQGDADPARRQQPAHRHLRLRRGRHPHRPDRPPRARDARVPRLLRPEADGLLPALRPRLLDRLGQRLRALDGHRGRHRGRQRRADHRPPGLGLDHRHHDPAPADPPGHDEAAPDHLPDDLRRHRQHVRDGRPRRPHPRRLAAALRPEQEGRAPDRRDPQARAVDQAHRPPRRDRQPRGARGALAVLAEGHQPASHAHHGE